MLLRWPAPAWPCTARTRPSTTPATGSSLCCAAARPGRRRPAAAREDGRIVQGRRLHAGEGPRPRGRRDVRGRRRCIGQYSECSFRLAGTGTFFGSEASNPSVGQRGRREEAAEWRPRRSAPSGAWTRCDGARRADSDEEPAYDVFPLRPAASAQGVGRIGALPEPRPFRAFAEAARSALGCGPVQVIGDPQHPVSRVAVACGAGGELLPDAVRACADVLLTGEARFHDHLAVQGAGVGAWCCRGTMPRSAAAWRSWRIAFGRNGRTWRRGRAAASATRPDGCEGLHAPPRPEGARRRREITPWRSSRSSGRRPR